MENITIIKTENNQCIWALYNPDDVKEYGITASGLMVETALFNTIGHGQEFIDTLADNFLTPYFQINTHDAYIGYKPVLMEFKQLPDDMVLIIVQFCKNDDTCDHQCRACVHNFKNMMDAATTQYIDQYLAEKDLDDTASHYVYVLKTKSLDDVLKACSVIPVNKCLKGDIIRHHDAYYMSITFHQANLDSIQGNLVSLSEFGDIVNPILHNYLLEHGDIISDKLLDLCQSDLTK